MNMSTGGDTLQYDETTHTFWLPHEWGGGRSVTTEIVLAVSAITNTPVSDMGPLDEILNPEALNDLYTPREGSELRRENGSTSFQFHGCQVTLNATGRIKIEPPDAGDDVITADST